MKSNAEHTNAQTALTTMLLMIRIVILEIKDQRALPVMNLLKREAVQISVKQGNYDLRLVIGSSAVKVTIAILPQNYSNQYS